MAGMISLTRDSITRKWTLTPAPGRNYGSPVVPESIRREATAQTRNFRRLPWVGLAQVFEVTLSITNAVSYTHLTLPTIYSV